MALRHWCLFLVVLLGIVTGVVGGAEPLNVSWRYDGAGRYPNIRPPTQWSAEQNVLWKTAVEVGGYSSPIVVKDKVFATAEKGELLCLDLATGKFLWKKDLFSEKSPDIPAAISEVLMRGCGKDSKESTPTPASNGSQVFYINAMGLCACYDLQGKEQWIRVIETADDEECFSSSPIFLGDRILISWGCLVALSAKDGRTLWKAEEALPTHGTPAITSIGGTQVAITPGGDIVRLDDGKILCRELFKSTYVTPLVEGNLLYLVDDVSYAWELPAKAEPEMQLKELWTADLRAEFMASPVYRDGLLYSIASDKAGLFVLDAKTGHVLAREVKPEGLASAQFTYASPAASSQNIFLFDDVGHAAILEPGPKAKVVRSNTLGDGLVGTPFFVDDKIILRGTKTIYCIGAKP